MPRVVDTVSDSVERVPKPANVVAVACSRDCETEATSFSMRGSASGRTACAPRAAGNESVAVVVTESRTGRTSRRVRRMGSGATGGKGERGDVCRQRRTAYSMLPARRSGTYPPL